MKAKSIGLLSVALFAEVGASFLLPLLGPTDSPIEAYYSGFFDYEAWRAFCWIPPAILIAFLYTLLEKRFALPNDGRAPDNLSMLRFLILWLISGLSLETLTSIGYWKSPHSKGVRALYESVWYWHRVPRQSDYGWSSFRGYFVDHLIPWVVLFLIGLFAWYIWNRQRQLQPNTPTTQ
jgi:hypothetical protein